MNRFQNIAWTSVSAALLAVVSIVLSSSSPEVSLASGLAAITFAVLSNRE
jgi:hypothetical protein